MTNEYLIEIGAPYIDQVYELWVNPEMTGQALKELFLEAIGDKRRGYIPAEEMLLYLQGTDRCLREDLSIGNQGVMSGMRLILV